MNRYQILFAIATLILVGCKEDKVLPQTSALEPKLVTSQAPPQVSNCHGGLSCTFEQAGAICINLGKSYICKDCFWLEAEVVKQNQNKSFFANANCKPSN
ncbi:MAG: hypothetical protein WCW31_01045 [Patescibacteria group bacterium]|jgi:hypothetical protein